VNQYEFARIRFFQNPIIGLIRYKSIGACLRTENPSCQDNTHRVREDVSRSSVGREGRG